MNRQLSKQEKIQLFKQEFPLEADFIGRIRQKNLTYCSYPKLENICRAIERVKSDKIPGIYLEAGCALGGSAILIGKMKPKSTPFYVFDVFSTIPAPSERDDTDAHLRYAEIFNGNSQGLGNDRYYGYVDNLKQIVIKNMQDFGLDLASDRIALIEGLFQDTLKITEPVAFAHIDCDWYDSVEVCIEQITPKMTARSTIIFDDYSSYSGCKKAVDLFLERNKQFKVVNLERSITITKIED
jgi:hypothetical protein